MLLILNDLDCEEIQVIHACVLARLHQPVIETVLELPRVPFDRLLHPLVTHHYPQREIVTPILGLAHDFPPLRPKTVHSETLILAERIERFLSRRK